MTQEEVATLRGEIHRLQNRVSYLEHQARETQFDACQQQYEAARKWVHYIVREPDAMHKVRDDAFWKCMGKPRRT